MFEDDESNCCKICNRVLGVRDIDVIGCDIEFMTRYSCNHCGVGCYLVIETDEFTRAEICCYCHRHP